MKTPKAFGLAAALFAALLVPALAMSAKKEAAAEITAQERKLGMAGAPAVVQALGLPCQLSDARIVGEDKKTKTNYFEVACAPGAMGYILQSSATGASAFSCIEANTPPAPGQPPSAPCKLPGNTDPKSQLKPLFDAAGIQCLPEQARGIGQTKTNTYVEVACQGGVGYVLVASAPLDNAKPASAQNCLMYDDSPSNIKCILGDKVARLAVVDQYVTKAANTCVIKDRRFVGMAKDNSTYFETSCQDGKGYIFKVSAAGALAETYDCAKASQILGGCTLTDARQAQTEQAGLYSKLAANAGVTCDVDKYALFPSKPGEEIVEMACKDGSGVVGLFKAGTKGQVVDCGRAPVAGYKCSLSNPARAFASLTADLKRFDLKSCEVSDSRVVGKTDKGTTYVEVACADKLKGYVIEYQSQPVVTAIGAVGCAFAGSCKLPGNT